MDRLSIIGVLLALAALLGGSVLKGAGLSGLWSPAAFVIVILGTLAAILVQTPIATFRRAMRIVRWVFRPPARDAHGTAAAHRGTLHRHRHTASWCCPRVGPAGAITLGG